MIQFHMSDDRRVRHVKFPESVSLADFLAYSQAISAEQVAEHRASFVDLSRLREIDASVDHLRAHVARLGGNMQRIGDFVEILYAPSDLAFGMARMYQNLVGSRARVLVYRARDEAEKMLARVLAARTGASTREQHS